MKVRDDSSRTAVVASPSAHSTPGPGGMIDRPGTQQTRERIGVQRTGAAERDQRVVARIVTLLDRHEPQRADHVLVDDVVDAERGVLDALAERLADLLAPPGARARDRVAMSPPSRCISGR